MTLTSNGLANAGLTTNFQVQYESTLPNQANVIANANALLPVLENEFTVTTGWFNTPSGKFGTGNRQVVNLNLAFNSGANNSGYGSSINMDAQDANGNAADAAERVKMLFMNEWVEILMSLSSGKWNAGDSSGEGLSQYCGIVRFQTGHYSYYGSWVNQWLNTFPRQDWVNKTEGTDKDAVSFGCALGFLFYLNTQLNISINQIIAAGSSNLAVVYRILTGDTRDPFQRFSALLALYFPLNQTSNLTNDNPFPLSEEQQHVFYRGADGAINHVFWHPPTKQLFRDQWTQLTSAPAAAGDPATMVWPSQQHVFYRGTDGAINHVFWDARAIGFFMTNGPN
jgi:hypothetical protein